MTFNLDLATRHAQIRLLMLIELRARAAMDRIDWMHSVGSGVCYCGDSYENHARDETHVPREIPRDKGYYDDGTDNTIQG